MCKKILLLILMIPNLLFSIEFGKYNCKVHEITGLSEHDEMKFGMRNGKVDGDIYEIDFYKNKLLFKNTSNNAELIFSDISHDGTQINFFKGRFEFTLFSDSNYFSFFVSKMNFSARYSGTCNKIPRASFDCSKARTTVEKAICMNDRLGDLDVELNNDYLLLKNYLKKDDFKSLKLQQRQWLKSLKSVCKNPSDMENCLIDEYKQRVSELNKTQDNLITIIKKLELEFKELTNKNINEYNLSDWLNDKLFAMILRVSILKRDYDKILALSHSGINISESMFDPVNKNSNKKALLKINSVENLKTYFDRLFPKKLIENLLVQEFNVTVVGPHNSNSDFDSSIFKIGEYKFLRSTSMNFTHNFLIMDVDSQLKSLVYDLDLAKLEGSLIRAKNTLDFFKQSKEIDKKFQRLGREYTKTLDIKKCLKNKIITLNQRIEAEIVKHIKKPFFVNHYKRYISKLKVKGYIKDRIYSYDFGPTTDYNGSLFQDQ